MYFDNKYKELYICNLNLKDLKELKKNYLLNNEDCYLRNKVIDQIDKEIKKIITKNIEGF